MPTAGHPLTRNVDQTIDLLAVHRAQPDQWPFLLSSTAPGGQLGRYSLLLFQHGEVVQIKTPGPEETIQPDREFLRALDELPLESLGSGASPWPFVGGWFVYLSYELVASIEPRLELPSAPDQLPIAYLARCPAALILDHESGEITLLGEAEDDLDRAQDSLEALDLSSATAPAIPPISLTPDPGDDFKAGVDRIREWIRAGDVFQVNLSRAWRGRATESIDPSAVYAALASANPSPFAGLARLPGGSVVSSSPERLVEVRDGIAQTRPIAGTRPRGEDDHSDASLSAELVADPKERAEHIMLIDLERNDLGRVCETGTVEVDELMVIESYAHVHHIVSNVKGRLRPEVSAAEVIRAVFPGGTITGCPKVRCMEIIAELEGCGRSFYTGSMGYIGRDGHLDLNILIRSLHVQGSEIDFRTGAGIVADSDRDAELAETEAKARGLIRALMPT
ncbi:MAG: aminodeoxychorismate synthase component I [Pseudomonadota bacterium]